MTEYKYGDPDDQMAARLVEISGGDEISWQRSDVELLGFARSKLRTAGPPSVADLGAGTGRLVPTLAAFSRSVVAVEPDRSRFEALEAASRSLKPTSNCQIETIRGTSDALRGRRFDLVLASHVVQHLASSRRTEFLTQLADLGHPGGVLLLTYSSSGKVPESRYYVSSVRSDGFRTFEVSEEGFDEIALADGPNQLPVWHPALTTVPGMIRSLGLSVLEYGAYRTFTHVAKKLNGDIERVAAVDAYTLAVFP